MKTKTNEKLEAEIQRLRKALEVIASEQGPRSDEPASAALAFEALHGREPTPDDPEWVK